MSSDLLTACGRPPEGPANSVPANPSARSAPPTIQSSPGFAAASAAFARHDFSAALSAIETLSRKPNLSSADREYLNRQRDICRAAVGTPLAASPLAASQGAHAVAPSGRGRSKQRPYDPPSPQPAALGDCGPRALAIVAASMGIKMGLKADAASLAKIAGTSRHGTNLEGMAKAAQSIGLEAEGVQVDRAALKQLDTPAIAWVDGDRFLAVLKVAEDQATIHDPNRPKEEVIETDELLRRSGGIVLKLKRK